MKKLGVAPSTKNPSLIFCIIMDLLGCASYLMPVEGEIIDIIWAPVSAIIFYFSFGGKKAAYGALFNFVEEIIPGTDIVPTFTIVWLWNYFSKKANVGNVEM